MGLNLNQEISFKKTPRLLCALFAAAGLGTAALAYNFHDPAERINYSDFIAKARSGEITAITEKGGKVLRGDIEDDGTDEFVADIPIETKVYESLIGRVESGDLSYEAIADDEKTFRLILTMAPITVIAGLLIAFMAMRGRIVGKVDHREPTGDVMFKDVAGQEEAKQDLEEVVEFLQNPAKFKKMGARIPKGVLMSGPPGLGKTLLAKAVANEAGVPFYGISGSDFVEVYAGVGAARVRGLIRTIAKNGGGILFIDEIDAMGRERSKSGAGGGYQDEQGNTLNALLAEMDGMDEDANIVFLAATNRLDILDSALTRPGRFDRKAHMAIPDAQARAGLLKVHSHGKPVAEDINFERAAALTPQKSGADMANIMNEAAIIAAQDKDATTITNDHLYEAIEMTMMGRARKGLKLSEEDRRRIAYHEAGHVVVGRHLSLTEKLHKVTIQPRGPGGGVTWMVPTDTSSMFIKAGDLMNKIAYLAGGRWAELYMAHTDTQNEQVELDEKLCADFILHNTTNGASNDIEVATKNLQLMLTHWGISEKLGFLAYKADASIDEKDFIGRDEQTAALIAEEARELVKKAYDESGRIIREHWDEIEIVAQALLENTSLDGEEVDAMLASTPAYLKAQTPDSDGTHQDVTNGPTHIALHEQKQTSSAPDFRL